MLGANLGLLLYGEVSVMGMEMPFLDILLCLPCVDISKHGHPPAHTSCLTKFLHINDINVMEWPAMAVMSPIEHVSDVLVCHVRNRVPPPVYVARLSQMLIQK